ncbi:MAG: DNA mismatch repair endonuclease MutL [bacterium]
MPRIKILPENLANMIAAGEIIDRPASVVKELVENSIDAGSDQIEVHLKRHGKEEIKVIDNGCGMGYHDALLAFERHATSKICEPADLEKIHTLGFRGEALPSIASVAQLTIITREQGTEIGTQVILDGGKLIRVSEIGAPVGTSVCVSSLFKNVPARLKFMKSDSVEFSHIAQILDQEALAHHQISFTFRHNGKTVWHMPKVLTLDERIQQLYGHEIIDHLLKINGEFTTCRVFGLIGEATYTRPNRCGQYTYVNGRFVRNPILLKAISEGYEHVLPRDRYPVCFLFLTISPEHVDVNVHPAKIEVRFSHQQEIFEGIVSLLKERLSTSRTAVPGISITAERYARDETCHSPLPSFPHLSMEESADEKPSSRELPKPLQACEPACLLRQEQELPKPCTEIAGLFPAFSGQSAFRGEEHQRGFQEVIQNSDSRSFLVAEGDFMQINNSFILFETRQGLVIVDQHAAHERVRYEQLQQQFRTKTLHAQQLLVPITFQVPGYLAGPAEGVLPQLHGAGFDLEPFGQNTFVIKAVPVLLAKTDPRDLIQEIFNDLVEVPKNDPEALYDALLMRMACSSAIKANHRLSPEEMRSLIDRLRETSMPFRCPHGRPTTIQLDLKLLEKYFLRG